VNTIIIPILPVDTTIEDIALECLRRIQTFTSDYHLVAIINGLGGGSKNFASSVNKIAHETVVYEGRLGYAKAINEGLNHLDPLSSHVTIGSCDIYPAEGWQRAFAHMESIGGSLISPLDMSRTHGKDYGYRGEFWAAWWTMPMRVVEALGHFDEKFNLRFAANDYAIRAHEIGYIAARAVVHFDHVAAKHSSVGPGFAQEIRAEERRFRSQWQGAYNYKTWVEGPGRK
jgi:hypothetical protein